MTLSNLSFSRHFFDTEVPCHENFIKHHILVVADDSAPLLVAILECLSEKKRQRSKDPVRFAYVYQYLKDLRGVEYNLCEATYLQIAAGVPDLDKEEKVYRGNTFQVFTCMAAVVFFTFVIFRDMLMNIVDVANTSTTGDNVIKGFVSLFSAAIFLEIVGKTAYNTLTFNAAMRALQIDEKEKSKLNFDQFRKNLHLHTNFFINVFMAWLLVRTSTNMMGQLMGRAPRSPL
jgi:hypothetical protein